MARCSVQRDGNIANSLVLQDYITKHIRKQSGLPKRIRPKGVDSCFGDFPVAYKHDDKWDGNPTQRRGMKTVKCQSVKIDGVADGAAGITGSERPTTSHPVNRAPAVVRPSTAHPRSVAYVANPNADAAPYRPRSAKAGGGGGGAMKKGAGTPPPNQRQENSDKVDLEELEATRQYLFTHGKFRTSPAKLLGALEVSRVVQGRPASAPGYVKRKQARPVVPKAGAWRRRPIPVTLFRKYYNRGDLPICIDHRANCNAIKWKISPPDLDFHVYLPIFFDGLREVEDPFRFLAIQGTLDLIEAAPQKVLPVIPQLILPLKIALNTRTPNVICPVLKILQQMILLNPVIGQALVPYYRQILPIFNLFRGMDTNLGDGIDYNQRSRLNLGVLILETLEVMEQFGGPDAFINIKYIIPTYESCSS